MSSKLFCFTFVLLSVLIKNAILWSNHSISTLKLLQVVHRHGDRNIENWYPNDPFLNMTKYWPEGEGELTLQGKYRMYRLGQFIRNEYNDYLGQEYSPREVYARSSAKGRFLESISLVLAGAYPPNNTKWQWNNDSEAQLGLHWQPIPIDTYIPMDDDRLLRVEAYCPSADQELNEILNSNEVINNLEREREYLKELSEYIGEPLLTLENVNDFYDTLSIEYSRGYKWSDFNVWTTEYENKILKKLFPLYKLYWTIKWKNSLIQRTRAGDLIHEIVNNFQNHINSDQNSQKLYIYSTHDSKLDVLMQSLNVFNGELIPFGCSLFIELHQTPDTKGYFTRIYFFNETLSDRNPHLLSLPKCDYLNDCPINQFFNLTKALISEDWDKECGLIDVSYDNVFTLINISILAINLLMVLVLIVLIVWTVCLLKRRRYSYQALE